MSGAKGTTLGADSAVKFLSLGGKRGSSLWAADLGNGITVSYGWSYRANRSLFAKNRATSCHAFANVDWSSNGVRVRRDEIALEVVNGCRTYADASRKVKAALAKVRAVAEKQADTYSLLSSSDQAK